MKFLTFIKHSELKNETPPAALMEAMGAFIEKTMKEGHLVETGGLLPTAKAKKFRVAKGKLTITDGPFSEAKEVVGGWAMLQGTPDEALRVAKEFVDLHLVHWPEFEFECEFRPVAGPDDMPGAQ